MKYYIIIPIDIVAQWQRVERGNQSLYFTQIKNGDWVINTNCGEELFPEIPWNTYSQKTLTESDFKTPPPLI